MGVRKLQTYLEGNCPVACYRVKIASLAKDFRDLHGEDPCIVMDGSSCFRNLYAKIDWICGGQAKEFAASLDSFYKKFKDLGIKIVVIFDSSIHDKKRGTWVNRRYQDMRKVHSVLDKLKEGSSVSSIGHGDFHAPCGALNVMESTSAKHAEVFRCVNDHTREIAEYAEKHKCMAILGQNSDFVIFNLSVTQYLSIEKLDLPTMSSILYDRAELASYLKLDLTELPLLATLMGNDTFVYHELNQFHKKMVGKVFKNCVAPVLVKNLAKYIHSLPKGEDLMQNLDQVSKLMFGTPNRARQLQKSIESYDLSLKSKIAIPGTDSWSQTVARAYDDCICVNGPPQVFLLLHFHKFEMGTAIEDYRGELPISAEVLKPIRRRMYGVALKDCPVKEGEPCIVEEFCMTGVKSLDAPVKVEPIAPQDNFPGLMEMWNVSETNSLPRWNVLSWIFSQSLYDKYQKNEINEVPVEIQAPLCLLSFLFKDAAVLTEFEVKVFAAVAIDVQAMNAEELSKIDIANVDVRGIQLATLYTRAINILVTANGLTGLPIPSEWVNHEVLFDGKLFQLKYSLGEDSQSLLTVGSEPNYDLLCKLVLE